MIILIILIIVITIMLILIGIKNNNDKYHIIENYDARYTDTSFPVCAQFCKTRSNCYGFGYDKENHICYPSQLLILGKPLDSIFGDEYSPNNATCNKVKPIITAEKNPGFVDRRANSVYVCSESNDKQPGYYFENKGKFKNIGEGRNIDDIFDVEIYEVKPYTWPRNKFDYDQSDLLAKYKLNQSFTPENITSINRIIHPEQEALETFAPSSEISEEETEPIFDFKLENIKNLIYGSMKKLGGAFLIPTNKYEVPKDVQPQKSQYISYARNNNYNSGQLLNDYKCVKDIPLETCLNYCSSDNKCVGFEWNPEFMPSYQNVCCPYKSIGKFIGRNDSQGLGHFYEKTVSNQLNKQNNYISV